MVANDTKRFLLRCYKRVYRVYFGYRHSEKIKQNIEIGKATLEDLGIIESINEILDDAEKKDSNRASSKDLFL